MCSKILSKLWRAQLLLCQMRNMMPLIETVSDDSGLFFIYLKPNLCEIF